MRRLLWLVWLPCLTKAKPRRPRQQEDSSAPPWLTDAYLPDASKFPPAYQPNNNQRGRREATRLARADAIVQRALCKLPIQKRKEVTALTPAKFVLEAAAARGGPVLDATVFTGRGFLMWRLRVMLVRAARSTSLLMGSSSKKVWCTSTCRRTCAV